METKVIELAPGVALEMLHIPSGTFMMGSSEDEVDRYHDEGPQHEVRVASFFMGRYPITQAQWRVVTAMTQVELKLGLNLSYFKGDNCPVEQVNWYEAMEFCARLSALTGQTYTLPSEAQWEYACRANTTTPFYFGETITTDQANYDGSDSYANGTKGDYRQKTTNVGSFLPNNFGLYDMHGNVWEWCLDHYSYNGYEGAPDDGTAWIDPEAEKNKSRILRGGSWINNSTACRCAFRLNLNPVDRHMVVGFRVVSVQPSTLE